MREQYSDRTIQKLRERFASFTSKGRQVLIDLENDFCEVGYTILLSSAGQIEGSFKHSHWGDEYKRNLSEIRGRLPQIIKEGYYPNEPLLKPIKGGYENQFILNKYQVPIIQPNSATLDCSIFIEFMERLFPIKVEREMVLALMTSNIRFPEKKLRVALLLRGEQGTGKGVLMDSVWGELCGSNYMKCRCSDIVARFNSFIASKTLICIDELYDSGKKNADKLKTPITEEKINVEVKGEERAPATNYSFIVATSNEYCPIFLEEGDRRWFVPRASTHKFSQMETQQFIAEEFLPWLKGGGLQAIRNYLERFEIDGYSFNLAMSTPSKKELLQVDKRLEYMEEVECFLEDGKYHAIRLVALTELYPQVNESDIRSILRKAGYRATKNAKSFAGFKRCRWWVNPEFINSRRYLFSDSNGFGNAYTYIEDNTLKTDVYGVQDPQNLGCAMARDVTAISTSCAQSVEAVHNE